MQEETGENEMKLSEAQKAKTQGAEMVHSLVLKRRNGRKAMAGVAIAIHSNTRILRSLYDLL